MGFLVIRDGTVEVKSSLERHEGTSERPDLPHIMDLIRDAENNYDLGS
jgi:hypothetical protein